MKQEENNTAFKVNELWDDKKNNVYVTMERFKPVEAFVKSFIYFILIGVGGAILAMVLK